MSEEREITRCGRCELRQFMTASRHCRRCGSALRSGSVQSTTVIIVGTLRRDVLPMRDVMRQACSHAVEECGGVMRACRALGISQNRLKQLLRESGDVTDYRKAGRRQRV